MEGEGQKKEWKTKFRLEIDKRLVTEKEKYFKRVPLKQLKILAAIRIQQDG